MYPVRRGRLFIGADGNALLTSMRDLASGSAGVAVTLLISDRSLTPFVQGGPRWGDAGAVWWNGGGGANVWLSPRFGLRAEYQYQRHTARFVTGPPPWPDELPPPPSRVTEVQHLVRVGVVFRSPG
jgi:hypothetical protein